MSKRNKKNARGAAPKKSSGFRSFLTMAAVVAIVGLAVVSAMVPPTEESGDK